MQKYDNFDDPRYQNRAQDTDDTPRVAMPQFKLRYVAGILVALVIAYSLWSLTGEAVKKTFSSKVAYVPTIKAEPISYRKRPDDPGGMDIPYQDSTIFKSDADDGKIENLFDITEDTQSRAAPNNNDTASSFPPTPKPIENIVASSPNAIPLDKIDEEEKKQAVLSRLPKQTHNIPEPEHTKQATAKTPAKQEPAKQENVATAPKPNIVIGDKIVTSKPETKPDVLKKAASTEPAAGSQAARAIQEGYYIQLSSVRDKSRASAEWASLRKKYSPLFNTSDFRVQTIDLAAKGTFHRLQAGPFTKEKAYSVCKSVKNMAGNGGCFVVAP